MSHCIKYIAFSLLLGQKYSAYIHQGHLMSPTSASRLNRIFLTCKLHCIFLYAIQKQITYNMEVRQIYNSYTPIEYLISHKERCRNKMLQKFCRRNMSAFAQLTEINTFILAKASCLLISLLNKSEMQDLTLSCTKWSKKPVAPELRFWHLPKI